MAHALRMSDDEYTAFLSTRSLGGSQVGAIAGVNKYQDAASVFDQILGLVPRTPDNNAMARGRVLEPYIATSYASATGRKITPAPRVRHPTIAHFHASADRFIARSDASPRAGILEIKALGLHTYGDTLLNGIDPSYYAQLQWYMYVYGAVHPGHFDNGAFAVFNAEKWELHHFDVERDDAYIEMLVAKTSAFWTEHIVPRARPTTADDDEPTRTPVVGAVSTLVTEPSTVDAIVRLCRARTNAKLAKHEQELLEVEVKAFMTDHDIDALHTSDGTKIYYREQTSTRFDKARLQREHPEVDLATLEKKSVSRTFKVYASGQEDDS